MWNAKYKTIDKEGLRPEIKVTVMFISDDNRILESEYEILPQELDSENFINKIQDQLNILNAKDLISDTVLLINKPIEIPKELTPKL